VRNPSAENLIKFTIDGPGEILAVGNANPLSTESYQRPERKAWQGKALVVIKSQRRPGSITLNATSPGLQPARVVINVTGS
jgi:beta-galactosidase